jgi:hypothetical protein
MTGLARHRLPFATVGVVFGQVALDLVIAAGRVGGVDGWVPTAVTSSSRVARATGSWPSVAPRTVRSGGRLRSSGARMSRLAAVSFGASGAHACHALATAAAAVHGQAR